MLSDQYIDGFLFVIIFHVLFVKPGQRFKAVVHDSF